MGLVKEAERGDLEDEGTLLLACLACASTLHLESGPPITLEGSTEAWAWAQLGETALTSSQSSSCVQLLCTLGGQCHSWHVMFASFKKNPVST